MFYRSKLIFHLCLKERVREYLESERSCYSFWEHGTLERKKENGEKKNEPLPCVFRSERMHANGKTWWKECKRLRKLKCTRPFIRMKRFVIGAITVVKQVRWPLPTLPHLVHSCHHLYFARLTLPCILD